MQDGLFLLYILRSRNVFVNVWSRICLHLFDIRKNKFP